MPQTMLAFLAMMMISISSLNQYQAQMRSYDNLIHSEYEIMANAVTIERMEIINLGIDWADLNALHGDSTAVSYAVGATIVPFTMRSAIQFVTVTGAASGTPTSYKEVALTTSHERFNLDLVTHTRIFAE